jgi:hypothetical protein
VPVLNVPEVGLSPDQSPSAKHCVALGNDQFIVVDSPEFIFVELAEILLGVALLVVVDVFVDVVADEGEVTVVGDRGTTSLCPNTLFANKNPTIRTNIIKNFLYIFIPFRNYTVCTHNYFIYKDR